MKQPFTIVGMVSAVAIPTWIFQGLTQVLSLQSTYQRIYAADSEKTARLSLIITGIAVIIWGIFPPLAGMAIYTINPELSSDTSFSWYLANHTSAVIHMAFLACVIMATMSTADSMLNSCAMNIGYDIYRKFIDKNSSDKRALRVGQIVTIILGFLSLYWAMQGGWFMRFFGIAASVSAGPLVAAVFYTAGAKKIRRSRALIAALIAGVAVGVSSIWLPVVKDILAGGVMFSFLTTLILAILLSFVFKHDANPGAAENAGASGNKGGSGDEVKPVSMARLLLQAFAPFWRAHA
jgi:Na+/proline symporter